MDSRENRLRYVWLVEVWDPGKKCWYAPADQGFLEMVDKKSAMEGLIRLRNLYPDDKFRGPFKYVPVKR